MSEYNKAEFARDLEVDTFRGFRDHLQVGDRAPKGTLVDLADGTEVQLKTLWRSGPLFLEFGSFS